MDRSSGTPPRPSLSERLRPLASLPPDQLVASLAPAAPKERRRKPDVWLQLSKVVSAVAWVAFSLGLAHGDSARPHWGAIGLDTWLGVERRTTWDERIVAEAGGMMFAALLIGLTALAIHSRYLRRETDRLPWPSVAVTTLSLLALLVCASVLA